MRLRCEFIRCSELSQVHSWLALLTGRQILHGLCFHTEVQLISSDQWRWGKIETPLIGLYDLGSRMLLQMIYFESWFCFSENKHKPLHQRLWCQTQSFLAWKMWLLFNAEISQGYKEGKKIKLLSYNKVTLGYGLQRLDSVQIPWPLHKLERWVHLIYIILHLSSQASEIADGPLFFFPN